MDQHDWTAEEVLALLDEGLHDGLTLHDAEARYLYVSPTYERLTGYSADELLGRTPFDIDFFHPDDVDAVVQNQARVLDDGEPFRILFRGRRSDGVYIWMESSGSTVERAGDPVFVAITRDAEHLDSLLRDADEERRLKRGFERLASYRRRFMTVVSHRARTPLTSIIGITELLATRDDQLGQARRTALLTRLEANVDDLAELLEAVTDADRLDRSEVVLERRVTDVRRLVAGVIDDVTALADRVTVVVPIGLRAVIDERRIARVLEILLRNAFKHAGPGAAVTVRCQPQDAGVELVVEDDGPGVAVEQREHIFRAFTNADDGQVDPGAGLGLYVVAEIVALHGGRVWVEDRPGGGARFHVWLPPASPSRELDGDSVSSDLP